MRSLRSIKRINRHINQRIKRIKLRIKPHKNVLSETLAERRPPPPPHAPAQQRRPRRSSGAISAGRPTALRSRPPRCRSRAHPAGTRAVLLRLPLLWSSSNITNCHHYPSSSSSWSLPRLSLRSFPPLALPQLFVLPLPTPYPSTLTAASPPPPTPSAAAPPPTPPFPPLPLPFPLPLPLPPPEGVKSTHKGAILISKHSKFVFMKWPRACL